MVWIDAAPWADTDVWGTHSSGSAPAPVVVKAPELGAKFDPRTGNTGRWRGGDVAFSMPMGDGRVLWLFGDTHWAFPWQPMPPTDRRDGFFTSDSIAMQHGMDPATATFEFTSHLARTNLFEIPGGTHYAWAQSCILIGEHLYVWSQRVQRSDWTVNAGWCVHRVLDARTKDPAWWNPEMIYESGNTDVRPVHTPVLVGGYVQVLTLKSQNHWLLARWSVADLVAGRITAVTYKAGDSWVPNPAEADQLAGSAIAGEGSTHQRADGKWFLTESAMDFPQTKMIVRQADSMGGTYTELTPPFVYDAPENSKDEVWVYAARAHSWMPGPGLVLSYCDNRPWLTEDSEPIPGGIADDLSTYWPKFIRVMPPEVTNLAVTAGGLVSWSTGGHVDRVRVRHNGGPWVDVAAGATSYQLTTSGAVAGFGVAFGTSPFGGASSAGYSPGNAVELLVYGLGGETWRATGATRIRSAIDGALIPTRVVFA